MQAEAAMQKMKYESHKVARGADVAQQLCVEVLANAQLLAESHTRKSEIKRRAYERHVKVLQTDSDSLRVNVSEAEAKLERMQYVCRKAERNVDVERRTLNEERSSIQGSLRKNVSKIHRNINKMNDMRQQHMKLAGNVRAITHRLNFEKQVINFLTKYRVFVNLYFISFFFPCV